MKSLPGYRGMGPVRIGNDAYRQVQHDVYGSAVLASTHVFFDERLVKRGDAVLFERLEALGRRALAVFDQPDAGLWELRGQPARAHVLERDVLGGLRPAVAHRDAPRAGRARARTGASDAERIRRFVDERCWSDARQSFVGTADGDDARREPAAAARPRLPAASTIRASARRCMRSRAS